MDGIWTNSLLQSYFQGFKEFCGTCLCIIIRTQVHNALTETKIIFF